MSQEDKDIWMQRMVDKLGSVNAVKEYLREQNKKNGFKPGNVPKNKIQDEFSDLPISRQQKHHLRKANNKEDV